VEASGTAAGSKEPKDRPDRIRRALRRARKLAGTDFADNSDQVGFLLDEARILATLEVADAVRDDQDNGSP
jgi:hypothetical protein